MDTYRNEEGFLVHRPNRVKASSKATRAVVVFLLLLTVVLSLIVLIGGWDKLTGLKALMITWILIDIGLAVQVARWSRGALAFSAALALLWGIFAAVSGPAWFDRDKAGFTSPALDETFLGMVTLIVVPVQLLLIAFSLRGFQQEWNVEEEIPEGADGPPARRPSRGAPDPQPAA